MKLDLHTHTIYSDGVDTPETIVARAKAVGLDGVAITDHNSVGGWKRGIEAGRALGIFVVPGNEIAIRENGKTTGEVIALFMQEDIKKKFGPSDMGDLLDRIKDQDALSVIPHPFGDYARVQKATAIVDRKGLKVDAVEVMNGRCPADSNSAAFEFAMKKKLGQTAGSDAHRAEEVGHCYTFAEADSIEEFRKAIKKRQSKAIGMQKSPKDVLYHRAMCKLEWIFKKK
ncbi:Error-prone DNA polymerase [uncultured archaeon]|nr:Error-prone DNA polymerase [uncultured archaeon]